jgi:hypothetical protein
MKGRGHSEWSQTVYGGVLQTRGFFGLGEEEIWKLSESGSERERALREMKKQGQQSMNC